MRIPILATILMLLAVTVLSGLGTWQVKRLVWKTGIVKELEKARETNPQDNSLNIQKLKNHHRTGRRYIRGHITGQYLHSAEIAVQPRTYQGISGYHIITPFVLVDGGTILVNRGWVSESKVEQSERPDSLTKGVVKVFGMAREAEKGNRFIPDNNPAADKWYRLDIKQISKYYKLENVAPYVFYAERLSSGTVRYPIPQDTTWMPNNNHLGYAIFWFSMIPALVVIYYLRFFKSEDKNKKKKKNS